MLRERVLKVLLVAIGLLFVAGVYPLVTSIGSCWQANRENTDPMFISIYVTLGIFLLLAARNPSAHRSVISFGGWANLAHAAVMTVMAIQLPNERKGLLTASALFGLIGAALLGLLPARASSKELVSTA